MKVPLFSSNFASVALLAEGVDRNRFMWMRCFQAIVALLAEGVDRNGLGLLKAAVPSRSPSSRRAWIEIATAAQTTR